MFRHWIWRSLAASFAGSLVPTVLMTAKRWAGLLPGFQPSDTFQVVLRDAIAPYLHPAAFWVMSFINGAALLGFAFGQSYARLPGRIGAVKGLTFGLAGWVVMGLTFFPAIGLGLFASHSAAGFAGSLFSLGMILTYSVTMGLVYDLIGTGGAGPSHTEP
jgi:hypothetical protein